MGQTSLRHAFIPLTRIARPMLVHVVIPNTIIMRPPATIRSDIMSFHLSTEPEIGKNSACARVSMHKVNLQTYLLIQHLTNMI